LATTEQDEKEKQPQVPPAVLIAYLQAHLVSGNAIDLLPIRHENDVKSDVTKLLEDWSKSGFLLRGNIAYPWHQVARIEVTRVEQLTPQEASQQLLHLEGADRAQQEKAFWKTRETAKKEDHQDAKKE
jgi:hypothetical protein